MHDMLSEVVGGILPDLLSGSAVEFTSIFGSDIVEDTPPETVSMLSALSNTRKALQAILPNRFLAQIDFK